MNSSPQRNVLLIGVSSTDAEKIAPFLGRAGFEVDRFPGAAGALDLLGQIPFELLIVRFPLDDINVLELLRTVRKDGSACLHAPLILLATSHEHQTEAGFYVGFGANRVLGVHDPPERIQGVISELLDIAPRSDVRIPVVLELRVGEALEAVTCETRNLSRSGMLIASELPLAEGDKATFELQLADGEAPIRGHLEVVRKTRPGREELGLGARFLAFAGDGRERLVAFLESQPSG